jgi:hypothetical protein
MHISRLIPVGWSFGVELAHQDSCCGLIDTKEPVRAGFFISGNYLPIIQPFVNSEVGPTDSSRSQLNRFGECPILNPTVEGGIRQASGFFHGRTAKDLRTWCELI